MMKKYRYRRVQGQISVGFVLFWISSSIRSCIALTQNFPRQNTADLLNKADKILHFSDLQKDFISSKLVEIHEDHILDAKKYNWIDEGYRSQPSRRVPAYTREYAPVPVGKDPRENTMAVRSNAQPLLDESTTSLLREVASAWWEKNENNTSTFTYQIKGNSEVHLADLCKFNETLRVKIRDALHTNIYPLVQNSFLGDGWVPHIYDSLVIRYNASAALSDTGAGQPLHRDMGVCSVNVRLNDEFQGGGTLFESQLDSEAVEPLKPIGKGHALLHYSNLRHAGAGTTSGIRDILVIFLTATKLDGTIHPIEMSARLKGKSSASLDFAKRAALHRTAIEILGDDGEAWHYLAMCMSSHGTAEASHLASTLLMHASTLIPNDARLYNNMGLVFNRQRFDRSIVELCYKRAVFLHLNSMKVGCDVETDLETVALNYGLHLANNDDWKAAVDILELIDYDGPSNQVRLDANRLLGFCVNQMVETSVQ